MKSISYLFKLTGVMLIAIFLIGCQPTQQEEVEITHTNKFILTDTIYQTQVHYLHTNVKGPKVAVIGGIHGDEIAGWEAAELLLDYSFQKGSYLIITRASSLAVSLQLRYPGINNGGWYLGVQYSDLNRIFPGKANGNPTEQIADAIIQELIDFDPDYIIDLHESRRSYIDGNLGDSVIYSNGKTSLFALEMVEAMNADYIESGDVNFRVDNSAPEGSLNNYCSTYFGVFVMTFETNRQLDLMKRIDQQLALVEILLNKI
jgi:predicted deacylase